ncbi:MAG: YitT family protein [Limnochordia bacterium]
MKRKPWYQHVYEYLGVAVGVVITAMGIAWFLVPARLAAGGVSGLGILLYHLFGLPVGRTMLAINIPLFLLSWRVLGPLFGVKTLFGATLLSFALELMPALSFTQDSLLAALYGGGISGIGIGIAFRFGGSTGGTDMGAHLLNHWTKISVGQSLLILDFGIILLAGFVFNAELALYALITLLVTTRTIDLVQQGGVYAKALYIISSEPTQVGEAILKKMERGVTVLQGRGMYTGQAREVLMVIVSRAEITRAKEIVVDIDPGAFMIITDVHEVLGEGFQQV